MAERNCNGKKDDGTPCEIKVGINGHGFCWHCWKKLHPNEEKEVMAPVPPISELEAGQDSANPPIVDPAEEGKGDDNDDQDPDENNQDPDPEGDLNKDREKLAEDAEIGYLNKARCPTCKGTENIVYKTDKNQEKQYRVCLVPKKHYPKKPKDCPKCGNHNPGRKCVNCKSEFLYQCCTRCGFPQFHIEESLVKRWKNRVEVGKKIYVDVKCAHPICKNTIFRIELCGNRFPVKGEKV